MDPQPPLFVCSVRPAADEQGNLNQISLDQFETVLKRIDPRWPGNVYFRIHGIMPGSMLHVYRLLAHTNTSSVVKSSFDSFF